MPKDTTPELMTLALADGEEHVLDLTTGRQWRQPPAALQAMRRIPQRSVGPARLEAVLHAAGIPCTRDADGDIVARLYGDTVTLLVNRERCFVRFVKGLDLKPFVPDEAVNAALRHLNNEYDVARFRCFREGYICADYAMSYEFGLSPQQLVEMLKGFAWTVQQAFRSDEISTTLS